MKQINQHITNKIHRMVQSELPHLLNIGFTSTNTSLYLEGYDRMMNFIQPGRVLYPMSGTVFDFARWFHQFKRDVTSQNYYPPLLCSRQSI